LLFQVVTFEPETLASLPVSKDMDFTLVSNKNFREILPSSG